MRAVIPCVVCDGNGCYAGNGETCARCKGWGRLLVEVLGPSDGIGQVQEKDIETTYAERDAAERALGFDGWDAARVEERRRRRASAAFEAVFPEWTRG